MKYWRTYQKDLILSYLTSAANNGEEVTVWQQYGDEPRQFKGRLRKVSRELCQLKLQKSSVTIDKSREFFVHLPVHQVIFKKEKFTYDPGLFEFTLPSDIQILEKREIKRYYYQYQDHKNITFHSEEIDPQTMKPLFMSSSVLIDISTNGAGMVIPKKTKDNIRLGQTLLLTNITDQKLPSPFKVIVKYIEPYAGKDDGRHKIGILFADELDSISYKSISSIVKIKQTKIKGLSENQYCGLGYQDQLRLLSRIENGNPVLASNIKDNLEYLDSLRYLTLQMKVELLQSINHDLLAIALRLSSKELIFDLFSEVTQTMQNEFLDKLQPERSASGVCKAQEEIIQFIREKEGRGEIVLDPLAFTTYV